jgi:hypothetical protein
MSSAFRSRTPWVFLPFVVVWAFLAFIVRTIGRIVCILLGLALMAAGVALTLSVVGAIVGVPLAAFGFLLLVRSLF